jgi:hypothetical protein
MENPQSRMNLVTEACQPHQERAGLGGVDRVGGEAPCRQYIETLLGS